MARSAVPTRGTMHGHDAVVPLPEMQWNNCWWGVLECDT